MPPSGYSINDSHAIVKFCKSISNELIIEGKTLNLTPTEALKKEINNIDIILNAKESPMISESVLKLTKVLYLDILNKDPTSYNDFKKIRGDILEEYESEILKIHVPKLSV